MLLFRLALVVAIFIAANVLTLSVPQSAAAARVAGDAYGVAVGKPPAPVPNSAYIQLPPEGGNLADSSPSAGYGLGSSAASTTQINTSTVGDAGSGNVTSTSTMMDGELLGGVVRVRDARVTVTASASGGRASSSASVTYGALIVAGVSYPNPSINQRIDIPGVGFVIVNEQIVGGDGRESASVVARAAHLTITASSLMDLVSGTELMLAHASAGVPDVSAARPVAPAPTATPTAVPWSPISPYRPIDVSLNGNFGNSNDDNEDDFNIDNGNDNVRVVNTATTTATTIRPTNTPFGIVITVVVVEATATPTATSTKTP
jgi:hypothetical protein